MGNSCPCQQGGLPLVGAEHVAAGPLGAEPARAALVRVVITECLTGHQLELMVLPSDSVGTIRQSLSVDLGVSPECADVRLVSGQRVLEDGEVAAGLPEDGLQCLRVKKTTFATLAIGGPVAEAYCAAGVLAPDGKIYFAPCGAARTLAIDPATNSAQLVGPELPGKGKYGAAGVLAPDGKIYFAPCDATRTLAVDPAANTVQLVGPELRGAGKYFAAGVLAPDGKIYFAPCDATRTLAVDPAANTVQLVGPELPGNIKYIVAGVLAPDGKIYFAPRNAAAVLVGC